MGVIDGVLWYKSFTIIHAGLEAGFMFTPEELRQTKIFACLDAAECARMAQNAADVRLKAGEWLVRSGETPWVYVLYEGRLRIVADIHGIQTEFPEYDFIEGDFRGEGPLCYALVSLTQHERKHRAASPASIGSSFSVNS